jgi:tetratricopeptide (TPR) repeat protein
VVDFQVLGAVQLRSGDRVLDIGPPQRCLVLAALAIDVGRLVTLETLIDRVWGDRAPAGANDSLYTHVSRIRKLAPATIVRRPGGYLLDVDPDRVDLHRFRRLVQQARAPHCPDRVRRELLHEALGLWRGEPMAGLSNAWVDRVRQGLGMQRLDAATEAARTELRLGNHPAAIELLDGLADEHPLSEPVAAELMRALHVAGRSAEALDRFGTVGRRLAAELGTRPGSELRQVNQAILRNEPVTDLAQRPEPGRPVVPSQLPLDVRGFTGRTAELVRLDELLAQARDEPTAVVISALSGTAGVGKSALAVHWAHRVVDRFPDGQLYVDLRGYDAGRPLPAYDAIGGFLRELGVAGAALPQELAERSARFRTLVTGKRLLVLLDNAATVEQLRPLLPGSPTCLVLVTSRDRLPALVTRHGAIRVDVNALPGHEAFALLRTLIGDRVDAEPAAARTLAEQCARLPLALRVAAELVNSHPTVRLDELVTQLGDEKHRLDVLDAGGGSLRAVFSWSLRNLPPATDRAFRLLGLHPGHSFNGYAMAALADCALTEAWSLLTGLEAAHLIEHRGPDRYGFHDLLRGYAAECANDLPETERRAARGRLYDAYVATAAVAAGIVAPDLDGPEAVAVPPAGTPCPPLSDPAGAQAWLEDEHDNLIAVAGRAGAHAIVLSRTLRRYLADSGHYADAATVHGKAADYARDRGDRESEAAAATNAGVVMIRSGRNEEGTEWLNRALTLHTELGDRRQAADVLMCLGIVEWRRGHEDAAVDGYRQAIDIYHSEGNRLGEARAMGNLAVVLARTGRPQEALEAYGTALERFREGGNVSDEGRTLDNMAYVYQRWGRYEEAYRYHRDALELARRSGDQGSIGRAHDSLGTVCVPLGRLDEALDNHRRALAIAETISDLNGEAESLTCIGMALARSGRYGDALDHLHRGLALAQRTGDRTVQRLAYNGLGEVLLATGRPEQARTHHEAVVDSMDDYERARAHAGLARCFEATGEREEARTQWRLALDQYARFGAPEAEEARRRLDER